MDKVILALDQATRTSGWSLFQGENLIDFGHWTFDQDDLAIRIYNLCEQISQVIDKYHPSLILIENIQMQQLGGRDSNISTFQKLAQVQGALMKLCVEKKIPYKLIYPTEWRKECNFLKGNDKHRDNQKKIAQEWVLNTFNKKCTQDEADAICIGYSEIKQLNNRIEFE